MFDKSVYISRRKVLAQKVGKGLIFIPGNVESPCNYKDNTYPFRQDSTFLYYFGIDNPGLAGIIDAESGEEVVFGDDVDIDDIVWTGPLPSVAEQAAEVGVAKTAPFAALTDVLRAAQKQGRRIHYIPQYRGENKILMHEILGMTFDEIANGSSLDLILAVVSQRLIKEPCEIAEIDKACDLGYAMHYTAMSLMKPGVSEQELTGAMEGVALGGGYMVSFTTILSQHGETLHNHVHNDIITSGKLCLIDAGAELKSHYCSDFTRTWPCSGKFNRQQKEIYTIVSTANQFALDNARPGITYKDVHLGAARIILQGLSNIGLVHGDLDEMVAAGVAGLFMPHGLGHNMGLDVHDMENLGENHVGYAQGQERAKQLGLGSLRMARQLEPGQVITDEPGIYFIPALIEQWKREGRNAQYINFKALEAYYSFGGIRLEDDLLITPNGARLLGSRRLPITVEDVEEAMRNN